MTKSNATQCLHHQIIKKWVALGGKKHSSFQRTTGMPFLDGGLNRLGCASESGDFFLHKHKHVSGHTQLPQLNSQHSEYDCH